MKQNTSRTDIRSLLILVVFSTLSLVLLLRWWSTGESPRWFEIVIAASGVAVSWLQFGTPATTSRSSRISEYGFLLGGVLVLFGVVRNFLVG
jgi:hypothetical protein